MIRVLVSDFEAWKRCNRCDVILSVSFFDNKPYAIKIKKNDNKTTHGEKFECITCATRSYFKSKFKKQIKNPTIEEIKKFLIFMNFKERKN